MHDDYCAICGCDFGPLTGDCSDDYCACTDIYVTVVNAWEEDTE